MDFEKEDSDFYSLDPATILRVAEDASGQRMSAVCRPYTSYINRVYELQTAAGESIVAKFYRPGRWTREALQEEHDFLRELSEAEIPIIAPRVLRDGSTLGLEEKMHFALFPKKGGRTCDEILDDDWIEVGRMVGRVHQIGATRAAISRVTWSPGIVTEEHVNYILEGNFLTDSLDEEYQEVARQFIELAKPLFEEVPLQRIHGDFHLANLIYRPGEFFFMIDFDDMAMGPAIQDLWMLLPGSSSEVRREINLFAEGYETFLEFPDSQLKLIEVLRGMRYIHFCAWCARQIGDGGFLHANPEWGTLNYWRQEIQDVRTQISRVNSELAELG